MGSGCLTDGPEPGRLKQLLLFGRFCWAARTPSRGLSAARCWLSPSGPVPLQQDSLAHVPGSQAPGAEGRAHTASCLLASAPAPSCLHCLVLAKAKCSSAWTRVEQRYRPVAEEGVVTLCVRGFTICPRRPVPAQRGGPGADAHTPRLRGSSHARRPSAGRGPLAGERGPSAGIPAPALAWPLLLGAPASPPSPLLLGFGRPLQRSTPITQCISRSVRHVPAPCLLNPRHHPLL